MRKLLIPILAFAIPVLAFGAYNFTGGASTMRMGFIPKSTQANLAVASYSIRLLRRSAGGLDYGIAFAFGKNSDPNQNRVWMENDNGDAGLGLAFKAQFTSNGAGWAVPYPTNNVWTNYTITYDGNSTSNDPIIYKDGVSQTINEFSSPAGTFPTDSDRLNVGNYVLGDQAWDGGLAEMAVWNRILTPLEAYILGKGFSPRFLPFGLVFYAPMVRNTGDIVGGVIGNASATSPFAHPRIFNSR